MKDYVIVPILNKRFSLFDEPVLYVSDDVMLGRLDDNDLALQLHFLLTSESKSNHDSEVMDDRCINRGDA